MYGAVRSLTDAHLRDDNEQYISQHFGHSGSFAILMSVKMITNQVMTPDFNSDGVVLYQWPQSVALMIADRASRRHRTASDMSETSEAYQAACDP